MNSSFNRIIALYKYYLYGLKRNPLRLFLLITWPVSDLLIWSFTANYVQTNGQVSNFLMSTIVCFLSWSVMWQIQNETCYPFLRDVYAKNLHNLMITPANFIEISLALFLSGLTKIIITFLTISLIAYFLFFLNILSLNPILIFHLLNLLIFGLTLGIISIALIIRFGPQVDFLTRTLPFYLWPALCVFYPRHSLPNLLQQFSYLLPPSYVFENIRYNLTSGSFYPNDFSISFLLNLTYLVFASIGLRFMLHSAKRNGNLARI